MRHAPLVVDHHRFNGRRHDGGFGIGAGKLTDRVHRLPPRDDQELNAAVDGAPENGGVNKTGNPVERRERLGPQVLLILTRPTRMRHSSPMPRDHQKNRIAPTPPRDLNVRLPSSNGESSPNMRE